MGDDAFDVHVVDKNENENIDTKLDADEEDEEQLIEVVDDEKSDEMGEWKQISEFDRNNVQNLREAFDELLKDDDIPADDKAQAVGQNDNEKDEQQNEQKEDEDDNGSEYADDFEAEISEMEIIEQELQEKVDKKVNNNNDGERDHVRLPDLDASINEFQSKVFSVYSSF